MLKDNGKIIRSSDCNFFLFYGIIAFYFNAFMSFYIAFMSCLDAKAAFTTFKIGGFY